MKELTMQEVCQVSGARTSYVIVSGWNAANLQDAVNNAMLTGYLPYSAPFAAGMFGQLYQALSKEIDG
jgi:hypothetical protein